MKTAVEVAVVLLSVGITLGLVFKIGFDVGAAAQSNVEPTSSASASSTPVWHPSSPSPDVAALEAEKRIAGEGLIAELNVVTVDGVSLRRVRDIPHGVVCYIAIGSIENTVGGRNVDARSPTVSCVKYTSCPAP